MEKLAVSAAEFDAFKQAALVYAQPDAQKRVVVAQHARTLDGSIEWWLVKLGDSADPSLLAGLPDQQDAGDLMETCISMVSDDLSGGVAVLPGNSQQSQQQQPLRLVVHSSGATNDSWTEQEKRERASVQADVAELERDASGMQSFGELVALAESGVDSDRDKLSAKVGQLQGALLRLINSSTEVSSMTVEAHPSTVQGITALRSVLDSLLERAVLGQHAARAPDRVVRAFRRIRTLVLLKVRLLHLVDKDDCGSESDPFAGFAKMGRSQSIIELPLCLQRLQAAWVFSVPSSAGQILQFVMALQKVLLESLQAGVEWSDLSTYYCKVMRRVDQKAAGFAGKSLGKQEPPDARWARDPVHEWVAELMGARAQATITAGVEASIAAAQKGRPKNEVLDLTGDDGLRGLSKKEKQLIREKRERDNGGGGPGKPKKQPKGQQQRGQQQQQQQSQQQQQQQQQQQKGSPGGKKETFQEKKARVVEELVAEKGLVDGKKQCYFFHGQDGGCRFSAGECNQGYH